MRAAATDSAASPPNTQNNRICAPGSCRRRRRRGPTGTTARWCGCRRTRGARRAGRRPRARRPRAGSRVASTETTGAYRSAPGKPLARDRTLPTGRSRTRFAERRRSGVVSGLTRRTTGGCLRRKGRGSSQACTSGTTDAPSPLALATRFIEPARMSPTAKIPGTVVSRFSGGSPSRHAVDGTSRPVSTKPFGSRATSAGASRSARRHRAAGTARRRRDGCAVRWRCPRPRSTPGGRRHRRRRRSDSPRR